MFGLLDQLNIAEFRPDSELDFGITVIEHSTIADSSFDSESMSD